jgi:hypothetical protein
MYSSVDESVVGISQVLFRTPIGFRALDEGEMLNFPWDKLNVANQYVFHVSDGGWLDIEISHGNIVMDSDILEEYLIKTDNECVSVISHFPPELFSC